MSKLGNGPEREASFDACRRLLELYLLNHYDTGMEQFTIEMERMPDGDSADAALTQTFRRIWSERHPSDDRAALSCCAQFVVEELIRLRKLPDEEFARQVQVAANQGAEPDLTKLWRKALLEE
jgi:hypothetical protein